MGKSFFDETDEARGSMPALTGALVEITGVERTKTGERSKNPGCRMYLVEMAVVEPKKFKGMTLRDYIVVGTAEDPLAKRPETWGRSEAGPGRLKRLLTRFGVPLSDDDEEWMEAAEGKQAVTPVAAQLDENSTPRNRPGLYYRPTDEDCPEIGEATGEEAKPAKAGKPGKSKGAAAAAKKLRGGKAKEEESEDDEDEKPAKKSKAADDDEDDDEDEKPAKSSKKSKKDDDDDDEDDE